MTAANDHDLLIELRTEMRNIRADIKEIKDGTSLKLDDHEKRIRTNEESITRIKTWGSAAVFVLGLIEVALQIYF